MRHEHGPGVTDAGKAVREALAAAGGTVLVRNLDATVERSGADLLRRAECLAGALIARGQAGGTVGLYFRNSAAAVEAFIATELIGATRLPVEPSAATAEAAAIFAAGSAGAVITDRRLGEGDPAPGEPRWTSTPLSASTLVYDDSSPEAGPRWSDSVQVDSDKSLVLYPRAVIDGRLLGIPTSYANWRAIISLSTGLYQAGRYGPALGHGECYLTVVQLMHATGMVGSFPFLHLGLPQVMMPRFNASAMIDAIRRHKVTTLFAVPGMLTRAATAAGGTGGPELSSLRRVLYGGAPIGLSDLRQVHGAFGAALCQLYGRYEAGWPLTVLTPDDHARILAGDKEAAGSCGRPVPGVEVGLRPIPGDAGKAEVRTRSAMVSPQFAGEDGWCDLGDTGFMSGQGYLHLTGRRDGMINTGSFHVYPGEVEAAIRAIPGVTAVLVVGEPHPRWGEAVVAYVESGDRALETTLRPLLSEKLAPYKVPAVVRVVDALPRTAGR